MKKKILVVDDNPQMRGFVANLLEDEGHQVLTAEDGLSALNALISFIPDIIFVDLVMPKIGGDKLCKIVRKMQHLQDCYLVLVSAAAAEMDFDYTEIGADACIAKGPIESIVEHILAAVRESDYLSKNAAPKPIKGFEVVHLRQMTKELLSQNRHWEAILDSMFEGILEIFSGRIIYANSAAVSLFGTSQEDLLSAYPPDLFADSARSQVEKLMESGTAKPLEIGYDEAIVINNKRVTLKKLPVKGESSTSIIMIRDVTERLSAEEELQKAHDELDLRVKQRTAELMEANQKLIRSIEERQQAHKMEAIGTLTGGIAHDFNNILGIIIGNTELALDDVPEWNPAHFNLEEIKTAGLRARDIVRQLLSFAHKTDVKRKPIKLVPVIKDSLKFLRAAIPTNIDIRQNIQATADTVLADPIQIHQVMLNLCTNASHAMEEKGGILRIEIQNAVIDQEAAGIYPNLASGNYVQVTVSDTGQGISPEIKSRIFDPYFTTKEFGKGTGMGLSVVHGIINSCQGAISVDSEFGKGAAFTVLLPVVQEEAVTVSKTAGKLPTGNERILFIDDEKSIVDIARQMMERLGYQVETKQDPLDALEAFCSKPDQFDLVITDMTMPHMTGDELAKAILNIRSGMPIILCTGFSEKISEGQAKELGVKAFALKPLVMRDLAVIIRKVLEEN